MDIKKNKDRNFRLRLKQSKNIAEEVYAEMENDIEKYNSDLKKNTQIISLLLVLGMACTSLWLVLMFISKHGGASSPLLMFGISCIWSIYGKPFPLMTWRTRILQCRQRTERLLNLIEIDLMMSNKCIIGWKWMYKELENVRKYYMENNDNKTPWTYDQEYPENKKFIDKFIQTDEEV